MPDEDRLYLEQYASLVAAVGDILHDRENLPEGTDIFGILRRHLDQVYDVLSRRIDDIEEWIDNGTWA